MRRCRGARDGQGNKGELLAALTHPKLIILDDPDEAPLCRRRITRPRHFVNRRIVAHPAQAELPVRSVRPTNGLISREIVVPTQQRKRGRADSDERGTSATSERVPLIN